jgi:poly(hydroxyalkanoate) granule-associated protein
MSTKKTAPETNDLLDLKKVGENLTGKAREVWLAGLGAIASVEEEGQKLFSTLVSKGTDLEKKGEDTINAAVADVKGQVKTEWKKVEDKVDETVGSVSEVFEKNVSVVLEKIGVPTSTEVKDLIGKVESLTKKVEELTKKVDIAKKEPAKKAEA